MSTLGASRVAEVEALLPRSGSWHADVTLDGGDLPSGIVVLTIGDLVLNGGTVQRAEYDAADKPHAVIFGGAGWHGLISKPISFQSDGGVRLSTVLSAIARGAGQTIEQPTDATIGDYYECIAARPGEPVRWSDALAELVRAGHVAPWRVDPDGVTRFGARPATAVTARATVLSIDAAVGKTTYGVDAPAQFLPGHTVSGAAVSRVVIRETSGKLELDVYASEPVGTPTIKDMLRRMVADAFGDSVRSYTVSALHGDGRLDLAPLPDATHLPEMKNVEQWVIGGILWKPSPGDECIVVFRDTRRTRPIAIGFKLGSGPFPLAARAGDTVKVLLPPAVFTGLIGVTPASGVLTYPTGYTLGTIETSSSKTGIE